jgi:hypothetical protein
VFSREYEQCGCLLSEEFRHLDDISESDNYLDGEAVLVVGMKEDSAGSINECLCPISSPALPLV